MLVGSAKDCDESSLTIDCMKHRTRLTDLGAARMDL